MARNRAPRDHRAEWQRRNQLAVERGYRNASEQKRARAAHQPTSTDREFRGGRAATIGRRPAVVADQGDGVDRDLVSKAVEDVLPAGGRSYTVTVQTSGGPRTVQLDDLDADADWYDAAVDALEGEYGGSWSGAVVVSVVVR